MWMGVKVYTVTEVFRSFPSIKVLQPLLQLKVLLWKKNVSKYNDENYIKVLKCPIMFLNMFYVLFPVIFLINIYYSYF